MYGIEATGKICLAFQSCADDFSFLYMVEKSSNIFNENISGIVGLARPRKFALAPETKTDKSKLIMEAVTDETIFSLSFDSL